MPTHSPSAPRTCIPAALDASRFENVEAHFAELLGRPVNSQPEFDQWLIDRSELDAACSETQANLYITMTCATDDEAAQKAYADYIEAVVPRLKPVSFDLDRRLVQLSSRFASPRHAILVRDTKADVDLYRQENVPIETELAKLSQAYDQLIGAMTEQFEGQERTLPQLAVFQERTDRDLRERAFRAGVERRLRDKDAIEGLFDHMVTLRHSVATNAGFQGFGDYAFKAKHRFDYTPRHCFDFHESCERLIVP
ncbi:MAG: M3 family oligoendopeptidase, partial [Phycisphaerae bacterium]